MSHLFAQPAAGRSTPAAPPARLELRPEVLDALSAQVVILDESGCIVAANERWRAVGLDHGANPAATAVGADYFAVLRRAAEGGDAGSREILAGLESLARGEGGQFQHDYECHFGDEHRFFTLRATRSSADGRTLLVLAHEELTPQRQAYEKLRHAAFHDELTGLPNRKLLLEHLNRCVAKAHRDPGQRFAILFLDLDRFKVINDSMGHARGDELLQAMADRLSTAVRESDVVARCEAMVARLGGDEFTILLDGVSSRVDAERIALRVHRALAAPFTLGGRELHVTASIGISMFDEDHRAEVADLLRDADIAMYQAKAAGKGQYQVFAKPMREDVVQRLELENDLRRALQGGQLQVHYQPVVSLHHRRIVGFEALIRWQHPTRGMVRPDLFIKVAEEIGVIVPIGRWVLATSLRQLALWQRQFSPNLWMSVNVSSRQLTHGGLVETVDRVMQAGQIDPRCLKLEITESALLAPSPTTQDDLKKLAERRIHLALDDFGTGYSSLTHLHTLPIDTLKIDRSFISRIHENERDEALVSGIVTLALRLGLEVIAEGVETARQAQMLRRMGAKLAQGYHFSKPLPADQIAQILSQQPWGEPGESVAGATLAA